MCQLNSLENYIANIERLDLELASTSIIKAYMEPSYGIASDYISVSTQKHKACST